MSVETASRLSIAVAETAAAWLMCVSGCGDSLYGRQRARAFATINRPRHGAGASILNLGAVPDRLQVPVLIRAAASTGDGARRTVRQTVPRDRDIISLLDVPPRDMSPPGYLYLNVKMS